MRIKTTVLYHFDELPTDEAKERAIESARERGWYDGSGWEGEWRDALKGAEETLPFSVRDWEVGLWSPSFVTIDTDEDAGSLVGVRAWKWLHANGIAEAIADPCPWTGYCGDEAFLDPLRAFLARPDLGTTLEDLLQACADSWVSGWVQDMEYQTSDEAIAESLQANEYEFDEAGNLD